MGKHAKTNSHTTTSKIATISTLALGGASVPLLAATPAHAADMAKWNCIASYESGNSDGLDDGVWNLPTGDADSTGGLQIQDRTWADFGGTAIAPHAYQATKAQQIAIAEKILAAQGPDAWATASRCDGVGSWTGTPSISAPTVSTAGTGVAPATSTEAAGGTLDPITGVKVPAPKAGSKADLAVKYAIKAISYRLPYVLGGNGPVDGGYDCSGLTSQAWKAAGVDFTESARDSYTQEQLPSIIPGASVVRTVQDLRPGDLVTYDGFAGGHVALYVGPIGPQGQDLIETNSRHSPGSVDWSFMDDRDGRGPQNRTTMVRPAPFVASDGSGSQSGSGSGSSGSGAGGSGSGTPAPTPAGKSVSGKASWFGGSSDPQPMANGQSTPPVMKGVALWNVPLGTQVTITSKQTGKSVTAPVVDRGPGAGPMANGVVIDLLPDTWDALGVPESQGLQEVTYTVAGSVPVTPPPVTPPAHGHVHHNHHGRPSWAHGTYTVKQDDWLIKIAREHLGDASKWHALYEANKGVIGSDPDLIQPGMVLVLPA